MTSRAVYSAARSRRRVSRAIMRKIAAGPISRADLVSTEIASHAYLDKLLKQWRERGWVESDGGVYSMTGPGRERLAELEGAPGGNADECELPHRPHTVALHSPPELEATITDADAGYRYDVVALALRSDGRIGCVVMTGDGPRVSWELEPGQELESRHRRALPEQTPLSEKPKAPDFQPGDRVSRQFPGGAMVGEVIQLEMDLADGVLVVFCGNTTPIWCRPENLILVERSRQPGTPLASEATIAGDPGGREHS